LLMFVPTMKPPAPVFDAVAVPKKRNEPSSD
jgi:hypothetical protein